MMDLVTGYIFNEHSTVRVAVSPTSDKNNYLHCLMRSTALVQIQSIKILKVGFVSL